MLRFVPYRKKYGDARFQRSIFALPSEIERLAVGWIGDAYHWNSSCREIDVCDVHSFRQPVLQCKQRSDGPKIIARKIADALSFSRLGHYESSKAAPSVGPVQESRAKRVRRVSCFRGNMLHMDRFLSRLALC